MIHRIWYWLMHRTACRRPPDFVVGDPAAPYLCRWYVIQRNRFCNVYLHQFWRSDDDRALHDHPWWSLSLCLAGTLLEHTTGGVRRVRAGQWRLRSARSAHRIEIEDGAAPVYTLFLTGPVVRSWGFHCPQGWVPWQQFTAPGQPGRTGPGCGGHDHD